MFLSKKSKNSISGGTIIPYTDRPLPTPCNQLNKDREKIRRIKNLLKQLKFEKNIEIEMNNKTDSMLDGKIVALEVVLAILKDKI